MDYSDDYDVYNLHKVHSIRTKGKYFILLLLWKTILEL